MRALLTATLAAAVVALCLRHAQGQITPGLSIDGVAGANVNGEYVADSMGAVGTDYYVELLNNKHTVYQKSDGSIVFQSTDTAFWTANGGVTANFSFDGRVVFDHRSGRFFAMQVDQPNSDSQYLLAVSNSANPADGWKRYRFSVAATGSLTSHFAGLGVSADGVFLTSELTGTSTGSSVVSIPKADLLRTSPAPSVDGRTTLLAPSGLSSPLHPVISFEDQTGRAELLAISGPEGLRTRTSLVNVSGTASFGITQTLDEQLAPPWPNIVVAADPRIPGGGNIQTGSSRLNALPIQVGSITWAAHAVDVGDGRSGIQWYKYQLNDGTTTFLQSDVIDIPDRDLYLAAINANPDGDVVIHYQSSGAGTGEYISSYAAVGRTNGGVTTFDPDDRMLLTAGTLEFTGANWGDYTAVSRDPTDPQIFWINSLRPSTTNEVWRSRVSELIVPAATGEARWKDGINGNFGNGARWIKGEAPSGSDHVVFSRATDPSPTAEAYVVTLPTAPSTTTVDRLSVRQGRIEFALNGKTLSLANAGSLTLSLAIAEYGGTPTVTFSGGTLATQNALLGAGALCTSATSRAHMTLSAGTWTNAGTIYVGGSAAGIGGTARVNLPPARTAFSRPDASS